ncbi:MAG: TIGR03986 family CRISPR-associated RAMP protein [Spirochaetaceae bacterium]|nr:TIGR03986 family CRISPR-associated RAMP protein [Spirochaetaceae bacterium]
MAETGKLVKIARGFSLVPEKKSKSGQPITYNPSRGCISDDIQKKFDTSRIESLDVEFDLKDGLPRNIRLPGSAFIPPSSSPTNSNNAGNQGRQDAMYPRQQQNNRRENQELGHEFHNPYNFVPALPRNTLDQELGDHSPARHDRFERKLYSGSITVTMETVTPLLIPDAENAETNGAGHTTFDMLTDDQGRPLIPASSVRGMLRSAYEIITNSRFSKFPKETHSKRLGYRVEAKESLNLVPVRIIKENSELFAELWTGTRSLNNNAERERTHEPLYAAWLHSYERDPANNNHKIKVIPCYSDEPKTKPIHGDKVYAVVQLYRHTEINHPNRSFDFWKVMAIYHSRNALLKSRIRPETQVIERGNKRYVPQNIIKHAHGYIFITNPNIEKKHDERLFFLPLGTSPQKKPIKPSVIETYEKLINNYQEIHKDELEKRKREGKSFDAYLGPEPGKTAWSPHVYDPDYSKLKDGDLCYAKIEDGTIKMLYPVSISRDLQEASPWDLLDDSLKPAENLNQLSPVDRVFGWVNPYSDKPVDQKDAWRGLLRLSPVRCLNGRDSLQKFHNSQIGGIPLAILGSPKPQQARFYVAKDKNGTPLDNGIGKKDAQYKAGYSLRGRKVYPHHCGLPNNYWNEPEHDRTQQKNANSNWYQEYRRPKDEDGNEQRDNQNKSIKAWIKPGTRFQFDIQFMNLSEVELGALLWLLSLNQNDTEKWCLRLGAGKPLGFGSVALSIENACFAKGSELMIKKYAGWDCRLGKTPQAGIDPLVNKYKEAMQKFFTQGYQSFDDIPCIKAFLVAAEGFKDSNPIHYPRTTEAPSPEGESFKWFVENERREKWSLPSLANRIPLPVLRIRRRGN